MAEGAAVRYVLEKLADPLLKKALDMYNVSDQIQRMKTELSLIQALLRDADSKRNSNELVNAWLKLVRDISYRIEDVIDTFLLVEENGPENYGIFSKLTTAVKNPIELSKLAEQLNEITQNLESIYKRRADLNISVLGSGSEENNHLSLRRNEPSHDVDDPEVVGHEADIRDIISHLLDRSISRRTVLSIVGIGGLGKTTVAQRVYKSVGSQANGASTSNFPQRNEQDSVDFERQPDGVGSVGPFDLQIWLSISKKFDLNNLLTNLFYKIKPPRRDISPPMEKIKDEILRWRISSILRHQRYLIVLDDVWTVDHWKQLEKALPDPNNSSRVIITTRSLDVATMADSQTAPCELRCLNDDESIALLFKTAGQQQKQHMVDVAKRLANKCGGLPLALVVLGGILKGRRYKYAVWDTLEKSMNWHSEDGEKCSKVLAMSYDDLPYDLKPCFLYFASFADNTNISAKHVTRMWLAEGFIPSSQNGVETVEAKADDFLRQLVQRCLIQVTKMSWNDNCKYCSMHELLQDMAVHKAMEDNYFTVFSKAENGNQLIARKPRRAALPFCTITKKGVYSDNTRSLLCFGFGADSQYDNGFERLNYSGFRLLRVLSIEGVDMRSFASKWLKNMKHLRYMGFRNCIIKPIIFKKKSFYNLETIDLKGTCIDHTWQPSQQETADRSDVVLPNLRHVYGHQNLEQICPLKWDNHTNLQTLKGVGQGEVPRLGISMKNLRTLGIHYTRHQPENWQVLTDVLRMTEHLVSLSIVMNLAVSTALFGSTTRLPCHDTIQNLHLSGRWDFLGTIPFVPYVNIFPSNLTKLTLVESMIMLDPMPILEKLQSLSILQLRERSYIGRKMICSKGGFPNLEKLEFKKLPSLQDWHIQEGAMPSLSHLKIDRCYKLDTLPNLQWVKTLRELFVNCPSPVLERRMQEEQYKIEHISALIIRGGRWYNP